MMMMTGFSRRRALGGAAAGLLSPLLAHSLRPGVALAQADGRRRARLVILTVPDGLHLDSFFRWKESRPLGDGDFQWFLAPWKHLRNDTLIVGKPQARASKDGFFHTAAVFHQDSPEAALPTIDSYIAARLPAEGSAGVFRTAIPAEANAATPHYESEFRDANGARAKALTSPGQAFDALFSTQGEGRDAYTLGQLDGMLKEHETLASALPADQRFHLEAARDAAVGLRRQITSFAALRKQIARPPVRPANDFIKARRDSDGHGLWWLELDKQREFVRLMTDLTFEALRYGFHNVGTVELGHGGHAIAYPWISGNLDFHEACHGFDKQILTWWSGERDPARLSLVQTVAQVHAWHFSEAAALWEKLQATPDPLYPGQRMSEHTVVMVASGGGGKHHGGGRSVPYFFLAPRALLKTGQYVHADGHHHSDVLIALARALGTDASQFGRMERNSSELIDRLVT